VLSGDGKRQQVHSTAFLSFLANLVALTSCKKGGGSKGAGVQDEMNRGDH